MKSLLTLFCLCFAIHAPACTIGASYSYTFLTPEPGVSKVVRTTMDWFGGGTKVDTLGPFTLAAFRQDFESRLASHSLAFIGRIDSVVETVNTGVVPVPKAPAESSSALALSASEFHYNVFMKIRVDTVLKGDPRPDVFWAKFQSSGDAGCEASYRNYQGGVFLNISNGLTQKSDLKFTTAYIGNGSPGATGPWFDGRYLVSKDFPGLRLDITSVLPTYPATGIAPRRLPFAPQKNSGKAWLPNGREAKGLDARTTPVPLLNPRVK